MKHLFTLLLLGSTLWANAQTFPYELTVLNEPYSDLEGATVVSTFSWDDPTFALPLGFDFSYMGTTSNSLFISDLGVGGFVGFTSNFFQSPQDLMIIYGSDIIDVGYFNDEMLSPISVLTEGDPGSRIAKIEWKNCGFYNELADTGTSGNRVSFQLWVYEGSNDFEIRFGMNSIKQPDLVHDFGAPFIGFVDDVDLTTNVAANAWLMNGAVGAPDLFYFTDFNSVIEPPVLAGDPPMGTVYRFHNTNVGIELPEEVEIPTWTIAGNPAGEHLNLLISELDTVWQFDVLDMSGRIVISAQLNNEREAISCAELAPGVYFARFINGSEIQTLRFVKN